MLRLPRMVLWSCAILVAASCSNDEPPATRHGAPVESIEAAVEDALLPEDAESSLAIKRGTVVQAEPGRFALVPCGESVSLLIQDQSGGLLMELAGELGDEPIYVEAYGERRARPHDAEPMFVLEQLLYAGPQGEVRGCERPQPEYIVAARGNEPFWALEVSESQMVWRQPDAPREIVFAAPEAQPAEGTVQYFGKSAEHEVELLVGEQACRDSMSGEFFAFSARATLDGRSFTGCARVGQ